MILNVGCSIVSCNFDVVIGGAEHNVYLLCHLDWNSDNLDVRRFRMFLLLSFLVWMFLLNSTLFLIHNLLYLVGKAPLNTLSLSISTWPCKNGPWAGTIPYPKIQYLHSPCQAYCLLWKYLSLFLTNMSSFVFLKCMCQQLSGIP